MAGVNAWLGGRSVILGGVLVHLCLGTVYTWGNLSVYVTSRLKSFHPSLTYADTVIVYGCQIGAQVRGHGDMLAHSELLPPPPDVVSRLLTYCYFASPCCPPRRASCISGAGWSSSGGRGG